MYTDFKLVYGFFINSVITLYILAISQITFINQYIMGACPLTKFGESDRGGSAVDAI